MEVLVRKLFLTIVGMALLAGCGGSSSPTGPSGSSGSTGVVLGGTYSGSASDSTGPGRMSWTITQTNSAVSGSVTATTLSGSVVFRGTLTGTVSGTTLTFTISVPPGGISSLPGCSVTVKGTATGVTSSSINGTYTGTNTCTGAFGNGQFSLTKQ